ncbi:hypothetical protein AMTRI_Chr07g78140 [Amborella trichopoda]
MRLKLIAIASILVSSMIGVRLPLFTRAPSWPENPWRKFPFTTFVAMLSAMITLMVESFATSFYRRAGEKKDGVHHSNGHGGGLVLGDDSATSMLRYRSLDLGIAVGIGLSNVYSRSSPTALIVVRILNAASAGLLNYMVALVDLLASDFMGPRFQTLGANDRDVPLDWFPT